MAENSLSLTTSIVNENDLKFVDNNGQILFSSEEIGRQLGYAKPAKSVNILFSRNQKELRGYAVGIKVMSTDGKRYEVRHFTEEGVYILSMLANTPRARDFRAMLARLLRELRERRVELAREAGYRQGLDEGQSFPVVEAQRKAAYLAGLREADRIWRRTNSPRALRRMVELRRMGCTWREIGKTVGASPEAARKRVERARQRGGVL
ncbi:Bro-N domain-containing protein [Desulfovibrio sp. ZJ200]|uniref:BRO-N domain-containing protein n=1 Tax=Desulfovibrio sp. ZJ200 TaxID=2709792 RepID=UPI0013EB3BDC|nr:Bro-N domain-containing protein [Desulfovibrio sp. ZJ200]